METFIKYWWQIEAIYKANQYRKLKCMTITFFCLTDIDECASDPCDNNATCIDQVNDVTCICSDGFTGLMCETGDTMSFTPIFKMF